MVLPIARIRTRHGLALAIHRRRARDVGPGKEMNHQRIIRAVDAQLTARGFSKVETGNADVLVAYHASFDKNLQIFKNYPPASR